MGGAHKYVSLDDHRGAGLAKDIGSYVAWVGSHVDPDQLIGNSLIMGNGDPAAVFDYLYRSMNEWIRARKSIRFTYLSLLGAIGVGNIEADHPYLNDLFFSKKGARWLFGGEILPKIPIGELNEMVI